LREKLQVPNPKLQGNSKFQTPNAPACVMFGAWYLVFLWSLVLGIWSLGALLFSRIGFGDDDADGVLIKSLETAFALQILQMTHDRPSPQNAFVGWGFGRRNGELIDRH
jgi:hypothetical protein